MNILISGILSLLLAGLAWYKKAMTYPALLVAFIMAFIITYYGGISCFLILTWSF